MVRPGRVIVAALVAALAFAAEGSAQGGETQLYLGGGATMPIGDYKEFAKTGWMASVGLGRTFGSGSVFGFVDGFYGKNSHETEDESTTLMGGGANIGISMVGAGPRLYGYAGLGMQNHKYNPAGGGDGGSETNPYARGAIGVSVGSGKTTFWAELGMLQGFGGDGGNTAFLPIMAGISIGL
jgi:hypothetical protein